MAVVLATFPAAAVAQTAWPDTASATAPSASAARLPAWDGGIDLYRDGVFTTQKSWLWCTAAGVQIVRNIVERDNDHSTAGQRRYFEWMRKKATTTCPYRPALTPRAGPPGCATPSTIATGSWRAARSRPACDPRRRTCDAPDCRSP